jgi:hypothetical protein
VIGSPGRSGDLEIAGIESSVASEVFMKSRAAGIALLALLAVAGSCELKLSPTKSANFLLSPGQTARAQELRVEFLEVLEDSRCPANTECVGPGDAIVLFRLRTSTASPSEVELHVVDPARRAAVFDGYIVELTALGPYPVSGQTIAHNQYRAAIGIRLED